MDLITLFKNIFKYNKKNEYSFKLSDNYTNSSNVKKLPQKIDSVFPSLEVNLEYMKTKYNLLINSDVILRQFTINARGKQYNSFIVYVDGMVVQKLWTTLF
ncbi:MAG: hypothetical protein V8R81_02230 [Clostridia bacterium]